MVFQRLLFSLVLFSILGACSDQDEDQVNQEPQPILALDPPNEPSSAKKPCLPLPGGWPNPWPCGPSATKPEPTPSTQLGEAINRERLDTGLTALTEDKKLACVAQKLAQDNNTRKKCLHVSLDGGGLAARAKVCGFEFLGGGEVAACGHKTPKDAILKLLESPKHRAVILNPNRKRMGTANVNNNWVIVFSNT